MGVSRRKRGRLLLAGAGVLLAAAVVFQFLVLPRLVDSAAVKTRIQRMARERWGAAVDFRRLALHLLPRPNLALEGLDFSMPPDIRASAGSLRLSIAFLPLLRGEVRVSTVRLESGQLDLTLPQPRPREAAPGGLALLAEARQRLEKMIASLPEMRVPRIDMRVSDSRLNLWVGRHPVIKYSHIDGTLRGKGEQREMVFTCTSTLGQQIDVQASLNVRTFKGRAVVRLSRLHLRNLAQQLFPAADLAVEGEPGRLELRLQTDGPAGLKAHLEGAVPLLRLRRSGETFDIRCPEIRGDLSLTGKSLVLSFSQVQLTQPAMTLSGSLRLDPAGSGIEMTAAGREVDVDALREAALGLLPGSGTVRSIFDVVRGGRVPRITVTSAGRSAAELGDMRHLVIRGEMHEGRIRVPGGPLDLREVSGRAVISGGILTGENLSARLGRSRGLGGTLRLGLVGDARPFHLDIGVQADLADLPPVLERLVDDRGFRRQLAMLREFSGTARGRLVLGERTDDVSVRADVDDIRLRARYRPIPFPIEVTSGGCSYRDTGLAVEGLTGRLGTSSFSGLAGRVDWHGTPYLKIGAGKLKAVLEDLLPWLSSFPQPAGLRAYYSGGKGVLSLASIRFEGPLYRPGEWRFAASGRIADLALNVPPLLATVTVVSSAVAVDNDTLTCTDARVRWMDADLTLSACYRNYLTKTNGNGWLRARGRLGARSVAWFSRRRLLPGRVELRPLTLSDARLDWDAHGETALKASVATDEGARASLELVHGPDGLHIPKLQIDDRQSHAVMAFVLRQRCLELSFDGNLTGVSLDRLLAANDILDGSIRGRFKARVDVGRPYASEAWGRLAGTQLNSVWGIGMPVKIQHFTVRADGPRIDLDDSRFTWLESPMELSGRVSFTTGGIDIDLRLKADEVRATDLAAALGDVRKDSGEKTSRLSLPPTVKGRLRVDIGRFDYGALTWRRLQATLSLGATGLDIDVAGADLCGIATPGTIHISPRKIIRVDFRPTAVDRRLADTVPCLFKDQIRIEGRYELHARVSGSAPAAGLADALQGDLEFRARDGRFYYDTLLLTVLEYLDAEKLLTGHVRDVRKRGRTFRVMAIRGRLEDDRIVIHEMEMDSEIIKVAGQGTIGLRDQRLNLNLLVAVVKTVNRALDKVPLVGGILNDMFSVPIKVKGTWRHPSVRPLAPSAVGAELSGIMRKIIPFRKK